MGGNYTVKVTQAGGCYATSAPTTVTVRPAPTFTVTPDGPLTFCQGGSVTFNVTNSNATFYIWYKNNNLVSLGTRNFYTANSAGVYRLRAYLGLCSALSNQYTVTIPCREGETIAGETAFSAYPNPFGNLTTFSFELANPSEVTIRLFDATGKLIDIILDKAAVNNGETKIEYETSHLTGGMYIAEIVTPETTKKIRLVSAN